MPVICVAGRRSWDLDLDKREQQWAAWLLAGMAGDAEAYRRFLEAVTPYLRSVAIRRCTTLGASRSDAEDIVQDVLLAVHLKRGTWDSARPIGPWLTAIVRNKVIDVSRRRGRRIDVPIDDVVNSLAMPEASADPDVKLLGRLLSQLKDNQRRIVTAISLEGATVREAAERFKMSEGAVRVALHRALQSLAALYRKGER